MTLAWEGFLDDVQVGNVAGTFEFFDTEAQNIIIRDSDDALASTYGVVDLGQWFDTEFTNPLRVGNFGLDQFVPRHNYNGEIWAVGIIPTDVPATTGRFPTPAIPAGFYIFRYEYFKNLTNILESVDTSEQTESQIKDSGFSIKNVGEEILNKTSSIFSAGSKVTTKIGMGDSEKMFVSTVFLDEVSWNRDELTMDMSGRNAIGYYLSEQTFDETITFAGTRATVVNDILLYSGVDMVKVHIEQDATVSGPKFESTDTLLDGLNYLFGVWGWLMTELPDGRLIIGSPSFHATFYTTTIHTFDKDESFTRGMVQRADGAYSRLALVSNIPEVVGVNKAFVRTVYKDIPYFEGWNIGNRRTLYINMIDNQTQETMTVLADDYAKAYCNIGVCVTREIPIHPEIQAGDVLEFSDADDDDYIQRAIVTGVKHKISVKDGLAHSTISLDSGGTIDETIGVKTYTAGDVTGDTRKRELIDVIRKEIAEKNKKVKPGGTQSAYVDGGDE